MDLPPWLRRRRPLRRRRWNFTVEEEQEAEAEALALVVDMMGRLMVFDLRRTAWSGAKRTSHDILEAIYPEWYKVTRSNAFASARV